jgi:hypothetical protein
MNGHQHNQTVDAPTTATANHQQTTSRSRTKRLRLPSPAMVVALGALVMSVGGNVTAAALITSAGIKDNTIRTVDVRDGTLKSVDVTNGTLTGADVKDGTFKGVDVASNSLTGADIAESSLGSVPSAANATNATNAQNAATLDGLDATSLTRVARVGTSAIVTLSNISQSYGVPLSITAPAPGFAMIHGEVTMNNQGCSFSCNVGAHVRHVQSGATSTNVEASIPPPMSKTNTSHAWVFPVNAGVNTFEIRVWRQGGDGNLHAWKGELAAIYSPFGSTGAGTL